MRRLVFMLACVLGMRIGQAQAPAAPEAAVAAARAAASDSAYGSALRVELITVGQGDLVFERYGHNLLRITDERTGRSVAWNWGIFDFDEPGFLVRFLFGNTRYRVEGADAGAVLDYYARSNRPVETQTLALTPSQRAALDAFVRTNAMPGNEYYRYDYFLDNCSTRLRDALDIVLGGAVRAALDTVHTTLTYRDETLRLNQHDALLFMGLDLALGVPADRALNEWQASFIPMRLRDALQRMLVPGPGGTPVPLAGPPRLLIDAERAPEPAAVDSRSVRAGIMIGGVIVALAILALARAARGGSRAAARGARILGAAVHTVFGVLATLIIFMWVFTLHAFWAWNLHLLMFTPLSFAAAVLVARGGVSPRWARVVTAYHAVLAGAAFCTGVAALLGAGPGTRVAADMVVAWATMSWMVHAALGIAAVWRGVPDPVRPVDPAAPGARTAA